MSRIRSIHPGLWTDEDFVTLSGFARLLFIGLWNECDDKGLFEWKPLTLKMRLMPADHVEVGELLAEIEAAGCVKRYEVDGRSYGAVRNFCKFQRPKKPNDVHPITAEIRGFVSLSSEPVPNQFPTDGEIAPQMEEGGGKMEGKREKEYKFSAGVVRLTAKDYATWKNRFHGIADFDAELTALAAWLDGQSESKQRQWFATGAGWLNRRHQEVLAAAKARETTGWEFNSPC